MHATWTDHLILQLIVPAMSTNNESLRYLVLPILPFLPVFICRSKYVLSHFSEILNAWF